MWPAYNLRQRHRGFRAVVRALRLRAAGRGVAPRRPPTGVRWAWQRAGPCAAGSTRHPRGGWGRSTVLLSASSGGRLASPPRTPPYVPYRTNAVYALPGGGGPPGDRGPRTPAEGRSSTRYRCGPRMSKGVDNHTDARTYHTDAQRNRHHRAQEPHHEPHTKWNESENQPTLRNESENKEECALLSSTARCRNVV